MAQPENRGAALAIETEVHGILQWFTAESAIDKSVPGRLWNAAVWDRPCMSKAHAFSVQAPFFVTFAGGHVPELISAVQNDTFELRARLTVV